MSGRPIKRTLRGSLTRRWQLRSASRRGWAFNRRQIDPNAQLAGVLRARAEEVLAGAMLTGEDYLSFHLRL